MDTSADHSKLFSCIDDEIRTQEQNSQAQNAYEAITTPQRFQGKPTNEISQALTLAGSNIDQRNDPALSLQDAVNRLISLDSYSNFSSPVKSSSLHMGCNTPLLQLLQTFSPSSVRYMDKTEESDSNKGTAFNFVQSMSPSSINMYVLSNGYTNDQDASYTTASSSQNPTQDRYYPGSMLAGATQSDTLPDLDQYFPAETKQTDEENQMPKKLHPDFRDEVLSTSEQQTWMQMNPLHNLLDGGNMLTPVMLSSYQDMAYLQQQLLANNYAQEYILPVFFQPLLPFIPDQHHQIEKTINTKKDDTSLKKIDDVTEAIVDKPATSEPAGSWLPQLPSTEEIMSQYKQALEQQHHEVRQRTHSTTDNMRYLEEAALKLLQNDTDDLKCTRKKQTGKNSGKYECDICHRKFQRSFTLRTHRRIHTGDKPFSCAYCGKGFRQSGTKLNHERAVHTGEKPFVCRYCSKSFSHKSSLTVHIRTHTKEKPYQCRKCPKRFTDRATYLKHQATHSGVKPYHCPLCFTGFSQKSNLKRHLRNIHSSSSLTSTRTIANNSNHLFE